MVFDIHGKLVKIQVKHAWYNLQKDTYVVDARRTKTNRRKMVRSVYNTSDFDFAVIYIATLNVYYVLPVEVFMSYGSEIHLVEAVKRQRKPKAYAYREAWQLISEWAA